uniref:Uncharacterized protein n=1 Tax=Timema monikensis TaxID=170555 RepID=A0A7R9EK08_9NEOP|nr:unnamed protein product [Timema monikensis]
MQLSSARQGSTTREVEYSDTALVYFQKYKDYIKAFEKDDKFRTSITDDDCPGQERSRFSSEVVDEFGIDVAQKNDRVARAPSTRPSVKKTCFKRQTEEGGETMYLITGKQGRLGSIPKARAFHPHKSPVPLKQAMFLKWHADGHKTVSAMHCETKPSLPLTHCPYPGISSYSRPMTSLVLTDRSQPTAFEKLPDQIMYPYTEPYDLQKHSKEYVPSCQLINTRN